MKTTLELPDALFRAAKRRAAEEGTTLRALVERGLRAVLDPRRRADAFTLRDRSFGGDGVKDGVDLSNWDAIRDDIYKGRGA